MSDRSRYVFGAALTGAALGAISGLLSQGHAATIAGFTFETSGPAISGTSAAIGPFLAEVGAGSAYGVHAASTTVWSSPVGNGSPESFSSSVWAASDYYEFDVPTTNMEDIFVSFDATSSSTGPKTFQLQYSTDGSVYQSFANYTAIVNAAGTTGTVTVTAWNSTLSQPAFNFAFDLSAIGGLDNNGLASFRLVNIDTTTATAGTHRVDNVVVSGTEIPEPAGLALVTAAAGAAMLRRRRNG